MDFKKLDSFLETLDKTMEYDINYVGSGVVEIDKEFNLNLGIKEVLKELKELIKINQPHYIKIILSDIKDKLNEYRITSQLKIDFSNEFEMHKHSRRMVYYQDLCESISDVCQLYDYDINAIYYDNEEPFLEEEPEDLSSKSGKIDQLANKAKILILKEIGFFRLSSIESMPNNTKGLLLSKLLGMNKDNAVDYISNLYDRKGDSGIKSPFNQSSIKSANSLLSEIGLKTIE